MTMNTHMDIDTIDKVIGGSILLLAILFAIVMVGWLQYARSAGHQKMIERHEEFISSAASDLKYQRNIEDLVDITRNGLCKKPSHSTKNGSSKKGKK